MGRHIGNMRVCDVVLNSIWYDPRVRKQIVEYKNNGVDVTCVGMKCNRYDKDKIKEIPCENNIVEINDKYDGKKKSIIGKLIREFLKTRVTCKAIINYKPDIIHANDFNALLPAYYAAKKLGCKLIYDAHEVNGENLGAGGVYQKYLHYMEKKIVKKVDLMISVSNAAADYFEKEYNIKKPLVVTNCSLKREICLSNKKNTGFEILNHGQFYAGRGYDIMVESIPILKEYPEIKLAIRGFGVMENQLHKRVEELNGENFIFYPGVKVEELIPYASKSMVGVAITEPICLNFKLSVSNKIFEYAAAGLPVIMSDVPEHQYLNNKYNFGIVLKENTSEEFAKAAIKFYEDKDFYKKCAENAIKMSNELNWENEFCKLINIEKNMLTN